MFDVVTTSIYKYARYPGSPELEDHTLALKLFAGKRQTRAYPTTEQLHDFGRRVCGVSQPGRVLETIAQAMHQTLADAKDDARVPAPLLAKMQAAWEPGLQHACAEPGHLPRWGADRASLGVAMRWRRSDGNRSPLTPPLPRSHGSGVAWCFGRNCTRTMNPVSWCGRGHVANSVAAVPFGACCACATRRFSAPRASGRRADLRADLLLDDDAGSQAWSGVAGGSRLKRPGRGGRSRRVPPRRRPPPTVTDVERGVDSALVVGLQVGHVARVVARGYRSRAPRPRGKWPPALIASGAGESPRRGRESRAPSLARARPGRRSRAPSRCSA